ncbi:hypothetical protein HBH56_067860 [Parastagonospora nodorum]|nr:hypothetical protein HBH56_067860 [Parastagonospora nodorum]KAH3932261.1 hypothetical protein HBH54_080250 [Parastagonospora nodorum]KAH3986637.1 hypothetical protein HBH52_045340 [Parastagonospora nodorum]KAH4056276.1 hypothetical protein HBH49_051490 [Parastagonospora nodorum]KAH4071266.1 hypothetical protein HBH50_078590 [Parastagonospora nodorum]
MLQLQWPADVVRRAMVTAERSWSTGVLQLPLSLLRQLDSRIEGADEGGCWARQALSTYLCKRATTTRVRERGSTM